MRNVLHVCPKLGALALAGVCAAALLLRCGPLPTDAGKNGFQLQLTLEDGTKTAAIFSGEPIVAMVTMADSVEFDSIAWHTGGGQVRHTGISPSEKSKTFDVELFWTSNPLCKDTATKKLFDSIYVSTHGETQRSNTVRVTVNNVPPVIDSVKVGTSPARTDDTIRYMMPLNDTSSFIALRAGASDVNHDTLRYDWYSVHGEALPPVALVLYVIPKAQFTDTVFLKVYDGKGGSADRVLILSKLAPDHAPFIDSIKVGSVVFSADTVMPTYSARTLDTLRLRVFARDTDAGDSVYVTWTKKNAKDSLMPTPGNGSQATMLFDTTLRKTSDTVRAVDTITVVVKDSRGDSARTAVRIVHGHLNTAPKLDSIRVDGVMQCRGPLALLGRDSVVACSRDTVLLRIFSSDPDSGDTVRLLVRAKQTLQVTRLSDTTAQYLCRDSSYTDTVVCVVKDLAGDSAVKRVAISVVNRRPSLDSIRVNGAMQCRAAASVAVDTGSGRDTFMLRIFASDLDPCDSVKLFVSAKAASAVSKLSDTTARYVCRDSLYTDTISCVVRDLAGDSAKKSIVIAVVNRLPKLDSLSVQDTVNHRTFVYKATDSVVAGYDSIAIKDSVKVRLFAHDPDPAPKDSIAQVQWTLSSGKTMKLLDTKGLIVQYPGQDAAGTDTVTVKITDTKQKTARTSLIFGIK